MLLSGVWRINIKCQWNYHTVTSFTRSNKVCITLWNHIRDSSTVQPAKSDIDVMLVYKVIRDLESIDHLCINPIHKDSINTQVIYRFALAQVEWSSKYFTKKFTTKKMSLSLLVGTTVKLCYKNWFLMKIQIMPVSTLSQFNRESTSIWSIHAKFSDLSLCQFNSASALFQSFPFSTKESSTVNKASHSAPTSVNSDSTLIQSFPISAQSQYSIQWFNFDTKASHSAPKASSTENQHCFKASHSAPKLVQQWINFYIKLPTQRPKSVNTESTLTLSFLLSAQSQFNSDSTLFQIFPFSANASSAVNKFCSRLPNQFNSVSTLIQSLWFSSQSQFNRESTLFQSFPFSTKISSTMN